MEQGEEMIQLLGSKVKSPQCLILDLVASLAQR